MRILFVGDVVGRSGRSLLLELLPGLRERFKLDFVVVNGENAAGGFGITAPIAADFFAAGTDVITLGNHAYDQKESRGFIGAEPRILRPANYPASAPGQGAGIFRAQNGDDVLVVNMMGRVFMDPLEDPFPAIDRVLSAHSLGAGCAAAVIDFHAEASSEKQAFAHHCDGRASLVVGTHTHVPTADHRILVGGTAAMTDVGMTGDYESIIGMDRAEPMRRFLTRIPGGKFEAALGPATLCAVAVETGAHGRAIRVAPLRVGGALSSAEPDFWRD